MAEIVKLTIPKLNEFIRIAEKKSVKPFLKDSKKKLPKKYQTNDFKWDAKGRLVNRLTGLVVPSNPITAGKPRDWKMNGQDLYNQKVKHNARNAIMYKMHERFKGTLEELPILRDFPLTLELNFYLLDLLKAPGRERNIDNDNRWIYHKVIQDTMTELGKIPDDNPYYINGNITRTFFVDNIEDTKLDIILSTYE